MNYSVSSRIVIVACLVAFHSQPGQTQPPSANRPPGSLFRNRTSDERVSRQAEVLRLQQMIDGLRSRVQRLERQSFSSGQFPAFTVVESEAALSFAETRLAVSEQAFKDGEASELQVAGDRLGLVRARAQLDLARAAHADRSLVLETDVAYAQRRLVEESQKQQQLQLMVAKGYTSTDGLDLQTIDVDLARNELLRARSRLELHQKMSGSAEPASVAGEQVSGGPISGGPISGGPISGGPISGGPISGGQVQ